MVARWPRRLWPQARYGLVSAALNLFAFSLFIVYGVADAAGLAEHFIVAISTLGLVLMLTALLMGCAGVFKDPLILPAFTHAR